VDPTAPTATARAYYEALDAGDYDRLAGLLAPAFRQRRPDRTLAGRDAFLSFVRDGRPRTDATHRVHAVYRLDGDAPGAALGPFDLDPDPDPDADPAETDPAAEVAVRGRLRTDDGALDVAFVDVFAVDGAGRLAALRTFTG
jgi:ketosteroid isomerase-like protein